MEVESLRYRLATQCKRKRMKLIGEKSASFSTGKEARFRIIVIEERETMRQHCVRYEFRDDGSPGTHRIHRMIES